MARQSHQVHMKSFGKRTCVLCMKERLEILKRSKENPEQLINSRGEIYGACRHKTKFHRFKSSNTKASTGMTARSQKESQFSPTTLMRE